MELISCINKSVKFIVVKVFYSSYQQYAFHLQRCALNLQLNRRSAFSKLWNVAENNSPDSLELSIKQVKKKSSKKKLSVSRKKKLPAQKNTMIRYMVNGKVVKRDLPPYVLSPSQSPL